MTPHQKTAVLQLKNKMPESLTLQALAAKTDTVLRGDAEYVIRAAAAVEHAGARDISFIRDKQYAQHLDTTNAGALILTPDLAEQYAGNCLISSNPYLSYAQVVGLLYPQTKPQAGIATSAVIAQDVIIGDGVHIGANVVIESGSVIGAGTVVMAGSVIGKHCRVGDDNYLHANVTLADDTCTGARVILHSGSVLGADGFGFVPQPTGWYKIPQVGCVVLGDDVEIGANTTVDRAALGETRIGNGVKLDNLIQIGHNTQIGEHTAVASCTAIAGSTQIGSHCQIAGGVSIAGHLSIADHVIITGTSMVINSIKERGVYSSGMPVETNALWRKNAVRLRQLDKLNQRVRALEKRLTEQQSATDC